MVNGDQVAKVTIWRLAAKSPIAETPVLMVCPAVWAAPVLQNFPEAAGSTCGALLPTGQAVDLIDGIPVTLIDNGSMPVMVLCASDVGVSGYESREEPESNQGLKTRIEALRLDGKDLR